MSLFGASPMAAAAGHARQAPLAERMRPRTLDEYVGQEHLLGPGKPLQLAIEGDDATSMIFWGPPGTGKTTLAKIIAQMTQASFIEFSAVLSGIKEIKQVMVEAEKAAGFGSRTILFVDEIHRFNKAQQDAFLPHVEAGTITLVGATTENPSFEINGALLSRMRVFVLNPLTTGDIGAVVDRALLDTERGLGGMHLEIDDDAREIITREADGDARRALTVLEASADHVGEGGRIITIGSNVAVRVAFPGASVYAMTKAAVAVLVKGAAIDLAARAITVNNIQPGPTTTDMTKEIAEFVLPLVPLGRMGETREIAGLVSYLAREEAGFITGASLTIDGGYSV